MTERSSVLYDDDDNDTSEANSKTKSVPVLQNSSKTESEGLQLDRINSTYVEVEDRGYS